MCLYVSFILQSEYWIISNVKKKSHSSFRDDTEDSD